MFYKIFINVEIKFFKKFCVDCWFGKIYNKCVIFFGINNLFYIKM